MSIVTFVVSEGNETQHLLSLSFTTSHNFAICTLFAQHYGLNFPSVVANTLAFQPIFMHNVR
jgi:hypothetical protein